METAWTVVPSDYLNRDGDAAALPGRASRPLGRRVQSSLFLLPAWFSPASQLRAAFHRARGVRIGRNAEIGYFVMIDNLYPDMVTIEEDATVAARTTILAHDEAAAYARGDREVVRPVRIGRSSFVGVHCVILPGVSIGERAIVGAGSVVTRDVPPAVTVAGTPARLISRSHQTRLDERKKE